ncbi:O-methyltransferase [Enemella dayhoffiae]|nr:class I SAM-dependent methyltransferase [Enemella dayhoffiae]
MPPEVPELVTRALRASLAQGYIESTRTETGRLLATLAATRTGTIAECGTGCGVGAAWLRSGAPEGTRVVTAESDPRLAECAQQVFAGDDIDVLEADWTTLEAMAPFSLLFLDAGAAKRADREQVIALVDDGGIVVIDDLVPCHGWPPMEHGSIDARRQEWLCDPRLASVETMVAEDTAVLVAVRRRGEPS